MHGEHPAGRSGAANFSLVNPAVLEGLRIELDDDEGWLLFISTLLAHLPRRMEKLHSGLLNADYDLSMDAVLSLKISCQMVGAEHLTEMALHLQHTVIDFATSDDVTATSPQLAKLLADMAACAEQTAHALGVTTKLKTLGAGG